MAALWVAKRTTDDEDEGQDHLDQEGTALAEMGEGVVAVAVGAQALDALVVAGDLMNMAQRTAAPAMAPATWATM